MQHISSRDALTDWFFSKIVTALNEEIEEIEVKNELTCHGEKIYGVLNPDDTIHLNRSAHKNLNDMAKTLLHEVLHCLFQDLSEEDILKLEDLIWKRLSNKQKEILKFYIPRSKS